MKPTVLVVVLLVAVVALALLLVVTPPDKPTISLVRQQSDRTDVPWQAPDVDPDNLRGF